MANLKILSLTYRKTSINSQNNDMEYLEHSFNNQLYNAGTEQQAYNFFDTEHNHMALCEERGYSRDVNQQGAVRSHPLAISSESSDEVIDHYYSTLEQVVPSEATADHHYHTLEQVVSSRPAELTTDHCYHTLEQATPPKPLDSITDQQVVSSTPAELTTDHCYHTLEQAMSPKPLDSITDQQVVSSRSPELTTDHCYHTLEQTMSPKPPDSITDHHYNVQEQAVSFRSSELTTDHHYHTLEQAMSPGPLDPITDHHYNIQVTPRPLDCTSDCCCSTAEQAEQEHSYHVLEADRQENWRRTSNDEESSIPAGIESQAYTVRDEGVETQSFENFWHKGTLV